MSEHLYGMYRGVVTTNADPEGRMRVKARVPQVLGGHETGWAWPCVSPGAGGTVPTAVPRPGQGVWILFEGGDISMPLWAGVWSEAPVTEPVPAHADADHADTFAPIEHDEYHADKFAAIEHDADHADTFATIGHAHDYPVDSVNGRTGDVTGLAESTHTHNYVSKAGDTLTGALILAGDPTDNLHAATKQYVDNKAMNFARSFLLMGA